MGGTTPAAIQRVTYNRTASVRHADVMIASFSRATTGPTRLRVYDAFDRRDRGRCSVLIWTIIGAGQSAIPRM